jgi:hypothetical protein
VLIIFLIITNHIINTTKNNSSTMASRRKTIDSEWANSLVELPVKIPDNWRFGYTGTYLHDGKIVTFNVVNSFQAMAPLTGPAKGYFF